LSLKTFCLLILSLANSNVLIDTNFPEAKKRRTIKSSFGSMLVRKLKFNLLVIEGRRRDNRTILYMKIFDLLVSCSIKSKFGILSCFEILACRFRISPSSTS
jgi:hypothetical protein